MPASIKPNRSEVSRAFPVAGFSIRTGITPSWFEVAVATTPELLYGGPQIKPQRNPKNFWSSRVMGLLPAERGEVVFLLPPQVLARFVGQERLYYGMATYRQNDYRSPEVTRLPLEAVPYLRISSTFTGSTRGLMGVGNSSGGLVNSSNQYVNGDPASLEWGADTPVPGEVVAVAAPTNGNGTHANGGNGSQRTNGNGNGHNGNGASTTNGGAAQQQPAAQGLRYDDGFDPKFWSRPQAAAQYEPNYGMEAVAQTTLQRQRERRAAPARPLSQVGLAYEPADQQQALALQAQFNQRRDQWRAGVHDTSFFPHSAICQLSIEFADGNSGIGTGFYIGPNRLLSCSHNFIHPRTGSLASSLTVIPGKNGDQSVAPAFTITSGWYTHPRYDRSFNFDLAVIDVPNSAPNGLYFTVLEALNESRESPIIVCGYSGDNVNVDVQHLDGDIIQEISPNGEIYYYNLQTEAGASGSPVYQVWGYEDPAQPMSVSEIHIVGVHVGGEDTQDHPNMNRSCRLTESKIAWINNPGAPASFGLGSRTLSNGRSTRTNGVQTRAYDVGEDYESYGIDDPIPDEDVAYSGGLAYSRALSAPEYPQASRFVPARHFRTKSEPRTINRIVIHITDGGRNINGTIGWFQNPVRNGNPLPVSAHYVIGQDGEIVQMVNHNDVAYHARSANGDSIGIEHCANTRGLNPTEAQYCASAALVNWLCQQYAIPMDRVHVLGHSEADTTTTHTGCPNAVWDWDYYMGMVTSGTCYPMPVAQAYGVRQMGGQRGSNGQNGHSQRTMQRSRAFSGQSFDLDWDGIYLIGQQTDMSCWAAAASMVIGWRDQVSIAEWDIARGAGFWEAYRNLFGLAFEDVTRFAEAWGLVPEAPQSYTIDGFRDMLERVGPLWVAARTPGAHVIVVTGLHSDGAPDGSDTFVRILDPWGRTPSNPNAPGAYNPTPGQGSQYELSWPVFVQMYESGITTNNGEVNAEIIHAGGTNGRTPFIGAQAHALGYSRAQSYSQASRATAPNRRPVGRSITQSRYARGLSFTPVDMIAVEQMRLTFTANAAAGAARQNCITITNAGLRQFYGPQLMDSSGNRLRLGSTIQDTMAALQGYGLAGTEEIFQFNDSSGQLTRGVNRPDHLQSSVENWLLNQADANQMSGWYVFGLSIMDGYHSVVLAMLFSGIGDPNTHIYWCDQIYSGWDDVTGALDARITDRTQRWWDPLPQNRKARTRVTLWPLNM